jgi:uncharacterized LabA/DUF88 family protein
MAIIKHKSQRVGIFIDTQNLYHSAKNLYKAKVNFGNVVKEALAGRILIRAVAYVIRTESEDEKSFFEALNKIGIETKVKDIRIFAGGAKKADWDIGMAIDAIAMANKLDTIVLATGDGDFVPLVEYLRYSSGIQVEVISFGKSSAAQLKDVVDDFIDMSGGGSGRWIPGFAGSKPEADAEETTEEPSGAGEDFGNGDDPAISMSGEE